MTRGALLLESKGRNACVTSNGPNVLVCKVLVTSSATDLFQKAISITRKLTCLDYGSGKGGFLCALPMGR